MISASVQGTEEMMSLEQHHLQLKSQSPSSSSRILDIPCKVCGDFSSGKHYNIFACDGCAGFFKRSIRRNRQYVCKALEEGRCVIDKTHRNQCRACRLQKCQEAGMNKDAVQHERGPRNSTLRRQQMSSFFSEAKERMIVSQGGGALNLAMPKSSGSPVMENPFPVLPPGYLCNSFLAMPRLPMPVPTLMPPPVPSPAVICESAARLLFMNVQWAKSMSTFTSLPFGDQLLLLEESWRELFILGAAQFLPVADLSALVAASGVLDRPGNHSHFVQKVQEFQDVIAGLRQFQLDHQEYSWLRAIVVFKTGFERAEKTLSDSAQVSRIQDDTQLALNKYVSAAYPEQPLRFGKILMLMPTFRNIPGETIEDLFFRKTIGNIPIVRIICDMYKSQPTL